jgi:hypothetical protein
LNAAPSEFDREHKVIVAAGNGLQGDVWTRFQEQFNVPEIREFYRSTESVAGFDNSMGGFIGVGKVGFSGLFGRFLEDTMFLVKYDNETENLYRDPETGWCVKASKQQLASQEKQSVASPCESFIQTITATLLQTTASWYKMCFKKEICSKEQETYLPETATAGSASTSVQATHSAGEEKT